MPKTILVADDSATIRRVVELAFSDTDVRVEAAASGREALERIRESPPDLVLADVVMPEPSGYEICRQVKRSGRPVPVLLLAGTFEPLDPERARACGADGHLVKPFESRALLEKVTEILSLPAAAGAPGSAPDGDLGAARGDPAGGSPPAAGRPGAPAIPEAEIEALAEAVVRRLSDRVLREIAWEVVPDLAEVIIRERIRELEREDEDRR